MPMTAERVSDKILPLSRNGEELNLNIQVNKLFWPCIGTQLHYTSRDMW